MMGGAFAKYLRGRLQIKFCVVFLTNSFVQLVTYLTISKESSTSSLFLFSPEPSSVRYGPPLSFTTLYSSVCTSQF